MLLLHISVSHGTTHTDLKLHPIACEGTSLVCEDVLDLSHFFIDAGREHFHVLIILGGVELHILLHEVALHQFNQFKGHNQRDRDERVQEEEIGSKNDNSICSA